MNRVLLFQSPDPQSSLDELTRLDTTFLKTQRGKLKSELYLSIWSDLSSGKPKSMSGVTAYYEDIQLSEAEWLVENVTPSVATAA